MYCTSLDISLISSHNTHQDGHLFITPLFHRAERSWFTFLSCMLLNILLCQERWWGDLNISVIISLEAVYASHDVAWTIARNANRARCMRKHPKNTLALKKRQSISLDVCHQRKEQRTMEGTENRWFEFEFEVTKRRKPFLFSQCTKLFFPSVYCLITSKRICPEQISNSNRKFTVLNNTLVNSTEGNNYRINANIETTITQMIYANSPLSIIVFFTRALASKNTTFTYTTTAVRSTILYILSSWLYSTRNITSKHFQQICNNNTYA